MAQQNHFKILLVGNSGVGKTTFLERFCSGAFVQSHIPTMGVEVKPFVMNTNYGVVHFDVWDCAGKEGFEGLGDGYYTNADGCIAMFSVASNESYAKIPQLIGAVKAVAGDIPIIACGNFSDIASRKVSPKRIALNHHSNGLADFYFDVSAKSTYNYEKPFLFLARILMQKDDLAFATSEAFVTAEA